jgi:hypothetical protein
VPVLVKLERIACDVDKLRPPDGNRQAWIDRLKAALEGERPRSETECAIVVQMACVHSAAMNESSAGTY